MNNLCELEVAQEREQELYDLAISRYMDKTGWDFEQWLTDEERQEYYKCQEIINGNENCPQCGDTRTNQTCVCGYEYQTLLAE